MTQSLADAIAQSGDPVELIRNSQAPPFIFPVKPEYSNWRSEQQAWEKTCALLDQSHHMADFFVTGPDALKFISGLAVNTFENFAVDKAKQFIAVNPDGYIIGDGILFYLAEESFDIVGLGPTIDWVQYNAEKSELDFKWERDDNSIARKGDPKLFRYELQGPNALKIVEKLTGGNVPDVKFFSMGRFNIAGMELQGLRHGMAGQPGFEFFGPYSEGEKVRSAILEAGEELGLVQVGAKGYSSANLESGWVPSPFAAIYSDSMKEYREWLPATGAGSLGGSYVSDDIEDYYVTPYDLGYAHAVAFDHDFIGREALEKLAENPPRKKVTLEWNADDVAAALQSLFEDGLPAKYIDLPKSRYAQHHMDAVQVDGRTVGISFDVGYAVNPQAFLSLAAIELEYAEPGTQVTVLWGENPNTSKPQVEPHRQVEMRATVHPVPYSREAREQYRK